MFPALLTFPSHHVADMFFIPFGKWGGGGCGFSAGKLEETPQNVKGEMPHITISDRFGNTYTLQSTKNYLLYCSIILPSVSDVYMNRKQSYISTDLFIKLFTQHFLKHKTSRKVIILLDGHRAHCSSPFTASGCCLK
jgi:hypothetical protein